MISWVKRSSQSLEEAVVNRQKPGFRFDNSPYWKKYYLNKFISQDFSREKQYAKFLCKQLSKDASILDVATGYGFLPLEIKKLGYQITCLDYYPEMIRMASEYFSLNNEDIPIIRSDAVDMPFRKEQFDAVTAMSILEHFAFSEARDNFVPELLRVLKPGGFLLIHVPVKSWVTRFKRFCRLHISHNLENWAIDDDGDVTHKVWMDVEEYYKFLKYYPIEIEFVAYNFLRSNEVNILSNIANKLLYGLFQGFTKCNKNGMGSYGKIVSRLATSAVFICRKK